MTDLISESLAESRGINFFLFKIRLKNLTSKYLSLVVQCYISSDKSFHYTIVPGMSTVHSLLSQDSHILLSAVNYFLKVLRLRCNVVMMLLLLTLNIFHVFSGGSIEQVNVGCVISQFTVICCLDTNLHLRVFDSLVASRVKVIAFKRYGCPKNDHEIEVMHFFNEIGKQE